MDERQWSLKNELLEKVKRGTLSIAEAEQQAAEHLLGAFESDPQDTFHPEAEVYWSTAMVLAWIMVGSIEAVRSTWDEYRRARFKFHRIDLVGPSGPWRGFELRQGTPCGLMDLSLQETRWKRDGVLEKSFVEAEKSLLQNLAAGKIKGIARINGEQKAEVLPYHWDGMQLAEISRELSPIYFCDKLVVGNLVLTEARFPSAVVQQIWKPQLKRRRGKVNAETDCQKWLESLMRAEPDFPTPKPDLKEKSLIAYEGLTKRGFERSWEKALNSVPHSKWGIAGRRKSSQS